MNDTEIITLDRAAFNQGENAKYDFSIIEGGVVHTLVARGPGAVCYKKPSEACVQEIKDAIKELNRLAPHQQDLLNFDGDIARTLAAGTHGAAKHLTKTIVRNKDMSNGQEYIVRRLTPLECNRLQGFPDGWGEIDHKDDFTEEEYQFWLDVRNTWAAINGKQVKDYTKEQMLKWYNKLHTDSAEYKMWGNGIALPCALYVMQGIAEISQL